LKRYLWDYLQLFLIAGLVVALDQWTKELVRAELMVGEIWSPWHWLTPYARIIHIHNTGAAFGMLQGFSKVFSVLAILVSAAIIYYYVHVPRKDWVLRLAMCLQLGGAVGNLISRINVGHVTDFISVGTFPVFNVADASISVGVVVLIAGMWLKEREQKRSEAHNGQDPASDPTNAPPLEDLRSE
jgi:signal peptidase II